MTTTNSEYRYAAVKVDDGCALAAKVGGYLSNDWGLHAMHDNVWEWCTDSYIERLSGGVDPRGPAQDGDRRRVNRGGSRLSHFHYCRSAMRQAQHDLNSPPYVGIRIVLKKKR